MKILLDIDNDLMEKLLQAAGTKVKKEAEVKAIKSFIAMKKRDELAEMIRNYDFGYTPEDLERMREDGSNRFGMIWPSSRSTCFAKA